jgi:HD superfamily phosphodiesterase
MGMTLNQMRDAVKTQRAEIAALRNTLKAHVVGLKNLRSKIKEEVIVNRAVKADARTAKRAAAFFKKAERLKAREAKRLERIAQMEAKLLALKSPKAMRKANQKAGPVVSYSPEQIAAMNAGIDSVIA